MAMSEEQQIALLLRKARKDRKLTQAELGNLLGVSKKVISDYELAKVNIIPFKNRVKLASILDIPIVELLYSDEKSTYEECDTARKKYFEIKDKKTLENREFSINELLDRFYMLKLKPVGAENLEKEILDACKNISLDKKIATALKIVSKNQKYSDSENFIVNLIFKILIYHQSEKHDVFDDAVSLARCITFLYLEPKKELKKELRNILEFMNVEFFKERKENANDTAQQ